MDKIANTLLTTFEDWTLCHRPPTVKPARIVLMLHGWTGDENSMWSFARSMPTDAWLLAPRAPFTAQTGGYSWRAPALRGWPTVELMLPAAAMLKDFIERWGIANAIDTEKIDVIGFSQGGAMSVVLGLRYPQLVRKMGVLAGFAPIGVDEYAAGRPLDGKTIFWAHGLQDEMVPVGLARSSMEILEQCGATINYCEADIGHRVSAECLRALEAYLTG
jgi:phospholipase/carboxylesterase